MWSGKTAKSNFSHETDVLHVSMGRRNVTITGVDPVRAILHRHENIRLINRVLSYKTYVTYFGFSFGSIKITELAGLIDDVGQSCSKHQTVRGFRYGRIILRFLLVKTMLLITHFSNSPIDQREERVRENERQINNED